MFKIMAVNCGSSSIKYKLFEMPEEKVICSGLVERIGHEDAHFRIKFASEKHDDYLPIKDHSFGVELILKALSKYGIVKDWEEIKAVGHRVVQGGKYFNKSAIFDDDTEEKVTKLIPLDPLHAPAHLMGYHAFKKALPNALSLAVFDTAFFCDIAPEDKLFPIPYEYTEKYDIRRYGAHGTSHNYLALKAKADFLKDKKVRRIITCHLGSGASLSATINEKAVATSMGLTPLGGVMMGTRCGDIDPSVFNYLCSVTSLSHDEVYDMLNKKSGFLGVSGVSNDTRDVLEEAQKGNERAIVAIKLWARRVADYIGSYFIRLGGVDLIVFSGGIGENASDYRKAIYEDIKEALHLEMDEKKNEELCGIEGLISTPNSAIPMAVIPTDEELMIAKDCLKALEGKL